MVPGAVQRITAKYSTKKTSGGATTGVKQRILCLSVGARRRSPEHVAPSSVTIAAGPTPGLYIG
jgi:hypothetical protein